MKSPYSMRERVGVRGLHQGLAQRLGRAIPSPSHDSDGPPPLRKGMRRRGAERAVIVGRIKNTPRRRAERQ